MPENRVKDGPACRGCGLPNYEGFCPVCRGDWNEAEAMGLVEPAFEELIQDEISREYERSRDDG